jgi:hypothetical protein
VLAIVMFFGGGFAFRSQSHTSDDAYVIQHTLVLPHSAIALATNRWVLY